MFADVISRDHGCPWGTTNQTSTTWRDIPAQPVTLNTLIATQPGILISPLLTAPTPYAGDPLPHVISWRNRFYLEDGHHRAMRAMLNGEQTMWARVLHLG